MITPDYHTRSMLNAISAGDLQTMKDAISAGADIHADGDWPLVWAAASRFPEGIALLLATNEKFSSLERALTRARYSGVVPSIKLLLDAWDRSEQKRITNMITTVNLSDWRDFRDLTLRGFRRLNVIVGPNASGKTSLMEGIIRDQSSDNVVYLNARDWYSDHTFKERFESMNVGERCHLRDWVASMFPDVSSVETSYYSNGFCRVANMLQIIATHPSGVVCIDEIENGIHHKLYARLMRAVDDFSKRNKTQVFFSTHSAGILSAMTPIVEATGHLSIISCSRQTDGSTTAQISWGEWATRALESGIELRG